MLNPDRWLERLADEHEMAETEEERKCILERIQDDADRRYDEMRDRELEVPRDE